MTGIKVDRRLVTNQGFSSTLNSFRLNNGQPIIMEEITITMPYTDDFPTLAIAVGQG
ncbi:hypothetical protein [Sporosarcina sp. JAI121]|uniref:hypothetical protein n=1 Tax=Sporosarcina sp. JAI121 TaxID=2723064 RepID=UPI0015CB3682|nr:hypothetical protein [Sporosarcina sp. JAI121]NYF26420.1 hypothetical protein [Sporosarcina sp. JAI121]